MVTANRSASTDVQPFSTALVRCGATLTRSETTVLQVNVGLRCNQRCRHCHLDAGPDREEAMTPDTLDQIATFAEKSKFQVVDLTGGAPELNPEIVSIIETFSSISPRVMMRTNLTAISQSPHRSLTDVLTKHGVVVIASLPSLDPRQLESQRGNGVWEESLTALRNLNRLGYGQAGSGLELNLVCNPTGAFAPHSQKQIEAKFRLDLANRWGIVFSNLYAFANAPLGRFREWLIESGNFQRYMDKLISSFNPCTVEALMCRTLISVSWDGYVYDCDFNLASGIPTGGVTSHVSELNGPPPVGTPIAVSEHCYCCTAGSGFT
jgi:radical SAM/Cys-rich protein